jgi:hypothetical protein
MSSNLKITPKTLTNQSVAVRQERRQLLKTFWLAVTVLFLVELYTVQTSSMASIGGAILIAFAALFPLYLWCSGKALGMPIFPLFSLTYLWTYGLPLVSKHSQVITYSPEDIFFASVTVAGYLGLGTFIWFQFVKSPPALPKSYRVFRGQTSDGFFLIILAVSIFFNMYFLGGWFVLEGGTFALIRGAILGLNVLSVFVLSYRSGTGELSENKSKLLLALLALYIITNAVSLLLVGALSIVLLAALAFIVGRRQVPWLPIIVALIFLLPLHYGKGEMREKYWGGYERHFVQPWEYPAWYAEWIGYSFDYLNAIAPQEKVEKQSFLERASLIHLLLMAQARTPRDVPYLFGATYAIIPDLLVPRIFNPTKIRSHEGTYLLNIHYGRQTRADTLTTTIGWGLLNEAYANFGVSGCAGLAIILGTVYGQAARWSLNTTMLSSRSLFAVLLMSFALQSEFSAGVYIAALFQSVVPLVVITFVFMKVHKDEKIILIYRRKEGIGK